MDGVWVGFPDTGEYMDAAHPDELLLALDELEAESLTECIAMEVDCCLPQLENIPSQYESAAQLIRHAIDFGYIWSEQGQGEPRWLDKFMAVMELEDCHRLDYALDLPKISAAITSCPVIWILPITEKSWQCGMASIPRTNCSPPVLTLKDMPVIK